MLDNIVMLGSHLANARHTAPLQLAEALATRHALLYVEPFGLGSYQCCEVEQNIYHSSLRQSGAGMKILSPTSQLLPEPTYYRWLMVGMVERINATRITEELEWVMHRFGIEEFALFIDRPSLRNSIVAELLAPHSLYLLRWEEWEHSADEEQRAVEPQMVASCDAVLATSEALAELPRRHNPHTFNISGGLSDLSPAPLNEVWRKAARRVDAVAELLERGGGLGRRGRLRKREIMS